MVKSTEEKPRRGRPPGSKNKAKRGRPPGSGKKTGFGETLANINRLAKELEKAIVKAIQELEA